MTNPFHILSRRAMLRNTACGFGMLGLSNLLASENNSLAPKATHFPARAKRVIMLFMDGGPSHVDTFDQKPLLDRDHLKPPPFKLDTTFNPVGALMKSPWAFRRYGESGMLV